jgi:hypothetical protein
LPHLFLQLFQPGGELRLLLEDEFDRLFDVHGFIIARHGSSDRYSTLRFE